MEHQSNEGSVVHAPLEELLSLRLYASRLKLHSHVASANLMNGSHGSHFKGRGMDYLESRDYQPGDDIRNMDWRVTARTQRAHIKLFEEERERPVMLMVDLGPGMFFASKGQFKSSMACRIAALLAWAAIAQGDRIGGLLFNGQHTEIQPAGGKKGILGFLHHLAEQSSPQIQVPTGNPDASWQFVEALKRMERLLRPGSQIFIISDFYHIDSQTRQLLARIRKKADIVLIQIQDALEITPPPPDIYKVSDGQQLHVINTRSKDQRQRYQQWFGHKQQQLKQLAEQLHIPLIHVGTDDDPVTAIQRHFSRRSLSSRYKRHMQ